MQVHMHVPDLVAVLVDALRVFAERRFLDEVRIVGFPIQVASVHRVDLIGLFEEVLLVEVFGCDWAVVLFLALAIEFVSGSGTQVL